MYSVVLAAMLSVGGETPTWGCRGCHGCQGCWGCNGCAGCHGCWGCHGCRGCHGCSGCYGYACSGCWGGYGGGYGYGGCYGGCYGCWGCYGCYGVAVSPSVVAVAPGAGYTTAVARAPADQALTPQTDAERVAVRDALDRVRYTTEA